MRRTLFAAALAAAATLVHAQYPQRPVQLIVPWGAGGGTDATARIIGALMEKELKQPFNVVNRTGGSGVVGHDVNARADSPYKSVKDVLAAVKANPGKFKASGTGQGGIWHLAIAGLLKDQGI